MKKVFLLTAAISLLFMACVPAYAGWTTLDAPAATGTTAAYGINGPGEIAAPFANSIVTAHS